MEYLRGTNGHTSYIFFTSYHRDHDAHVHAFQGLLVHILEQDVQEQNQVLDVQERILVLAFLEELDVQVCVLVEDTFQERQVLERGILVEILLELENLKEVVDSLAFLALERILQEEENLQVVGSLQEVV